MNEKESEKMKIKLKDGSFKEYDKPMRIIDIAADLSEGLARMACVGEVNGKVQDLRTVLNEDLIPSSRWKNLSNIPRESISFFRKRILPSISSFPWLSSKSTQS